MALKLAIALLCVMANAFFVAAEFALVKVRTTQLEARLRKGDRRAAVAIGVVGKLNGYLSASQLGITLASLALGWLGEPTLAELLTPAFQWLGLASEALIHGVSFTIAFATITILHIVVGEQAPKLLAIQRAESVALWTASPMRAFYLTTWPLLWMLDHLSRLVLRALRLPVVEHSEGALSAEEIRLIVTHGQLEPRQRQLLERVFAGAGRPVRAVMVPRVDMVVVSLRDEPAQVIAKLRANGYSRVPVTEGDSADGIVGYVYVKDFFVGDGLPSGGLRAIRRDALYVPETRTVVDVLGDMQRSRIPFAVVVDEYGGTAGLATLEDIVEELVGELQDELDTEPRRISRANDGSIVADGIVPLSELEPFGVHVEPHRGHELLAGFIITELGRLARPGDNVKLGDWDATVEDVRARRVGRVRLIGPPTAEPDPDAMK